MAELYPDENVNEKIDAFSAFIDNTKVELEKRFGILYNHGKPRDMSELQRQKLLSMCGKLEDLQKCIGIFQKELFQVCETNTSGLKPTEMRVVRGRTHAERESGYSSATNLSQCYSTTPNQSHNRLSRNDADSVTETFEETAEFFNPSIPGIYDYDSNEPPAKKDVPSFYLQSPPPSIPSLNSIEEAIVTSSSNAEEASTINPSDVQTESKELNDLSKNSSEEDNMLLGENSSPPSL